MHEEAPAVNQVVGLRLDRVGEDVVAADHDPAPKVAAARSRQVTTSSSVTWVKSSYHWPMA